MMTTEHTAKVRHCECIPLSSRGTPSKDELIACQRINTGNKNGFSKFNRAVAIRFECRLDDLPSEES